MNSRLGSRNSTPLATVCSNSEMGLPVIVFVFESYVAVSCGRHHALIHTSLLSVVAQVYDYEQTRMMLQYAAFTQTEGAHEGGGKWPAFQPVGMGGLLSAPSYRNLESYCDFKFTAVRAYGQLGVCGLLFYPPNVHRL